MSSHSYGALPDSNKEAKDWESRGSLFGLIVDVGCAYAYSLALVITLFFWIQSNIGEFVDCEKHESHIQNRFSRFAGVCICEYTKAYLFAFSTLGSATILLMIGRDLLQKRFYYSMLRAGGVIEFVENVSWKDPMFIALYVSFLHLLVFFIFATNLLKNVIEAGDAALHEAENGIPLQDRIEDMAMVMATIVPITMVVMALHLAYDIQKSLIPLSEFVKEDMDRATAILSTLKVVNDSAIMHLVDQDVGCDHAAVGRGQLQDSCIALLSSYEDQMHDQRRRPQLVRSDTIAIQTMPTIGLFRSLWPARLLMRSDLEGQSATRFQNVWNSFALLSMAWMIYMCLYLAHLTVTSVFDVVHGEPQKMFSMAVYLAHFVYLIGAITCFVASIRPRSPMYAVV